MSDDYQIHSEKVGDWECAVKYRVIDAMGAVPCFDVRWWVVENLRTHKVVMWAWLDLSARDLEGCYPILIAVNGKIEFFLPHRKRTGKELGDVVDMVRERTDAG